jgi:hypothetical protein
VSLITLGVRDFADPEGYLWEVATGATQLPFAE